MNMAPNPTWMRLFIVTILVQSFFVNALPNPDPFVDQSKLDDVSLALLSAQELTPSDIVTSTNLFGRETDGENGFEGGAAFKGVDVQSWSDEQSMVEQASAKKKPKHSRKGKKHHHLKNKPQVEEKQSVDGNSKEEGKNLAEQKSVVKGQLHTETHITGREAAKGGKLIKSAREVFPAAKPVKAKAKAKPNDLGVDDPCLTNVEHEEITFVGPSTANLVRGNLHDVSDALCPPGSISHSYSFTTTWSLGGQVGPDLKDFIPKSVPLGKKLDKFGIRFGVQYSWSNTQSTTYTGSETSGQNHPFVITYRPRVMVVKGNIQKTTYVHPFKTRIDCYTEHPEFVEMHLPIHTNDDCTSHKTACGPSVSWDHCFFLGAFARDTCPDRKLGPTPEKGRQCPVSFYPPQYLDGHGGIRS